MSFAKKMSIQEIDGKKGLFIPLSAIEDALEYVDEDFDSQSVQAQLAYEIEEASLDGEVSDCFYEIAEKIKLQAKEERKESIELQRQFDTER